MLTSLTIEPSPYPDQVHPDQALALMKLIIDPSS